MNINLARKWRSASFETIIGQDIAVRLLKNSLYLGQFFPVYLFAGQRGCGKTSSARIFAAALNCEQLAQFQKDPKSTVVPCGTCQSCQAMRATNHPDFIEIDAASHTGVDNVRQIVEASSLLPVMGRKKIYLIDEAHMLSKAAFNALLKVLEEPPDSTTFMLATTDPHKIIDTVRSRCFQLFFTPIDAEILVNHLAHICAAEEIRCERSALGLIVAESDGSARDAINMLEAVRFSAAEVTEQAVRTVLGRLSDDVLHKLADALTSQGAEQLLNLWQEHNIPQYSAEKLYDSLLEFFRKRLWAQHGADGQTIRVLEKLCAIELAFSRTTKKHLLLELTLVGLCSSGEANKSVRGECFAKQNVSNPYERVTQGSWSTFLTSIETLNDPLLKSIFVQGKFIEQKDQAVMVEFPEQLTFFTDWLNETKKLWLPLLQQQFAGCELVWNFIPGITVTTPVIEQKLEKTFTKQPIVAKQVSAQTELVLQHFPGTTTVLHE